jgi:hypothetical protein
MKSLQKILLLSSVLLNFLPTSLGSIEGDKINKNKKYSIETLEVKKEGIEINIEPPFLKVKPNHCARYAIQASNKLFGKEYNYEDAWNLRYSNKILKEIRSFQEVNWDSIPEGTILGVYNPKSNYNKRKDKKNKKIKYSHVVLYVGNDNKENPWFIHQWGKEIEKISIEGLLEKKLRPIEIIDSKSLSKIPQN